PRTTSSSFYALSLHDALPILIQRFAEFVPTPEVSVIVKEVRSFKVSIIGEIKTPGRYEFKSRTTVLDALAQAGPFTNFASPSRIDRKSTRLNSSHVAISYAVF